MQLAQQDLSMACTGQSACHLGEEALSQEVKVPDRGSWGQRGRLSPGFGRWVVIALFNPWTHPGCQVYLGAYSGSQHRSAPELSPLTLGVCVYVWAGGLALFSSCLRGWFLFPTWWKHHLCNPWLLSIQLSGHTWILEPSAL